VTEEIVTGLAVTLAAMVAVLVGTIGVAIVGHLIVWAWGWT
jgi:hypothetical protein